MPRQRNSNRDKAYEIWVQSNGEKLLKEIAVELGVSDSQIRKWKSQDKWEQKNGNVTNSKRSVTKQEEPRYPNGHPGNKSPVKKFTERNQAARKHGMFSRYMPKETLEIMQQLEESTPADLVWMQIQIQFSAIIRAQEIMFVESKDEMIKELKKQKRQTSNDMELEETEWEFQFAWDRQATFLNAQTKALAELRGSIKQFVEMADSEDERRLKLSVMQQQLRKLEKENESGKTVEDKLSALFDAIEGEYRDS